MRGFVGMDLPAGWMDDRRRASSSDGSGGGLVDLLALVLSYWGLSRAIRARNKFCKVFVSADKFYLNGTRGELASGFHNRTKIGASAIHCEL